MHTKRLAVATAAALLLVGTGTAAYAYWTTGGTGSGTATTAPGASGMLSVSGNAASAMYPGDSPQTVTATVTNTSTTESYQVTSLKAYLTIDGPHATAGCSAGDYKLNGSAAPGTPATAADLAVTPVNLAAGGTTTKTFTLQFNDLATAQDFCKGAAVTINYVAA